MYVFIWLICGLAAGALGFKIARGPQWGVGGDLALGLLGATLFGWLLHVTHLVPPSQLLAHGAVATAGAVAALVAMRAVVSLALRARTVASGAREAAAPATLEAHVARLGERERRILGRLLRRERVVRDPNAAFEEQQTLGQRVADRVASFGGSWPFIGLFTAVLIAWLAYNGETLRPFDPFPFILLNLVLSCLAAVQAPVIMMSQNRMSAKDRSDARHDYEVNLKAEMEIMELHAKLDDLVANRWRELLAIQERQIEVLARIEARIGARDGSASPS
jgi:uncharacterized membrane protein/uncharacterized membrane protein YeaQ/YmgE (transglycosylase-associated protein family)